MKSWGVIGRSSLLKSCNNFNLNASMATCQAAPFIGTYETNTIGYYILVHDGTAEPLRVSPPEAVAYLLELDAHRLLSYRLLWFETEPRSRYPARALAAVTTHDLPTIAGLWSGADLQAQPELGLQPNTAALQA